MAKAPFKLALQLAQPRELLARLMPNGRLGGLMLEGAPPGELGARCDLTVRFSEPVERHFTVTVQLAWVRHRGSPSLKEGFGVDFIEEDEAGRERLLAYAREEVPADTSRFDVRIATALAVTIRHEGKVRNETLFDLSQGGAFIRTGMFLPVGSFLEFQVRPPRALTAIRIRGRVAWIRKTGVARGLGIEFVYESARQALRVQKLLVRIRAQEPA